MTHLNLEDRNVWGVPGPKYEPELVCAHPFCNKHEWYDGPKTLERHHLWPRSFLRNQPTDWVKLPDGKIVQNCVYLCRDHHQQITENKARILFEQGPLVPQGRFMWNEDGSFFGLNPQPRFLTEGADEPDGSARYDKEKASSVSEHVHEGQECPTCHRRVPKKRKATTPTSKTISFRLPLDNVDQWEEIIEAAAKHTGDSESAYWKWRVIERGLVLVLQEPSSEPS